MEETKTAPPAQPEASVPSGHQLVVTSVQMSPWAECTQCDFSTPHATSAMTQAEEHAQKTGHQVIVDEINRAVITVKPR